MRVRFLSLMLLRLMMMIAAFSCGSAHADWYYSWVDGGWGGQYMGGSGATKYYSYEAALQAARKLNNGGYQWQWLEASGGYSFAFNPNVPHDGYYGLSPSGAQVVPGATVDDVCSMIFPLYKPPFRYTGDKWRTSSVAKDYWDCKGDYIDPQGYYHTFNIGVWPYCDRSGYGWSGDGNFLDFYNRLIPPGVCYSSNIGRISAAGFNPYKPDDCCIANPVNPALGIKSHREGVYASARTVEPLTFEWLYSTNMSDTLVKTAGWSHNFGRLVFARPIFEPPADAFAYRQTGFIAHFNLVDGTYVPDADISDRLTRSVDGNGKTTGWTYYVAKTEETETYNAAGQLISIKSRAGATLTLLYSDSATPPSIAPAAGLLIAVSDAFGRHLDLTYSAAGRVASLTDPAGRVYSFACDVHGNLVSITWPDTTVRQFVYENTAYPNALTGIIDETGQRFATYAYDAHGRAISESHAGVDNYSIVYNADGSSTVTDPLGTSRQFKFVSAVGAVKNAGISQPCATCGVNSSAITYDGNGNVSSRTDFNNKKTCYAYDLTRNLETARLEGALSTETCSTVLGAPPSRPDVRKVTTTWNATYRLPATISEPAPGGTKTTAYAYDASGNLTQKSTVAPANDGSGGTITRSWMWTYTAYGRVLTATDPNNHITTTTYYADNDPDPGKRGSVQTITNAMGHVTRFMAYDLNGRPLTVVDPNGLTTSLAYDARGRLVSRQVGTETTTYAYDGVGQLTKVTRADGSYLQYSYDAAHRLVQIDDALNNKLVYTLDAAGNRIAEDAYDPTNALARVRQQVYDSLNRLHQAVGAQ